MIYYLVDKNQNDGVLAHAGDSKSKYAGGFTKDGKNTKEYNADYYSKNKDKWKEYRKKAEKAQKKVRKKVSKKSGSNNPINSLLRKAESVVNGAGKAVGTFVDDTKRHITANKKNRSKASYTAYVRNGYDENGDPTIKTKPYYPSKKQTRVYRDKADLARDIVNGLVDANEITMRKANKKDAGYIEKYKAQQAAKDKQAKDDYLKKKYADRGPVDYIQGTLYNPETGHVMTRKYRDMSDYNRDDYYAMKRGSRMSDTIKRYESDGAIVGHDPITGKEKMYYGVDESAYEADLKAGKTAGFERDQRLKNNIGAKDDYGFIRYRDENGRLRTRKYRDWKDFLRDRGLVSSSAYQHMLNDIPNFDWNGVVAYDSKTGEEKTYYDIGKYKKDLAAGRVVGHARHKRDKRRQRRESSGYSSSAKMTK